MSNSRRPFDSFDEFWPFYVLEHARPETQAIHAVGTSLGVAAAATALLTGRKWLIPAGLALAYGAAWYSHFRIEKNKPASFKYPVYSFLADFKMVGKIAQGEMSEEVRRARMIAGPRTIDMG